MNPVTRRRGYEIENTQKKQESSKKKCVDWSQLPGELLAVMAKRLATLSDVICFSTVCQGWRRAVLEGDFIRCPPLLMLPFRLSCHNAYRFYCPFTRDLQVVSMPPDRRSKSIRRFGGSVGGWLVEARCQNVNLVNPLLQRKIKLPSLPRKNRIRIAKIALSPSERGGEDFIAMAICKPKSNYLMLSTRVGEATWRMAYRQQDCCFSDIMYHKEQFHVVTADGRLATCTETEDRDGLDLSFIIEMPPLPSHHPRKRCRSFDHSQTLLAESSKEELLLVVKYKVYSKKVISAAEKYWFQVFKLEHKNDASPSWLEVKSLGEDALFLSRKMSISRAAASSLAYKENCIYFPSVRFDSCISIFSMEERRIVDDYQISLPRPDRRDDEYQWVLNRRI